jgi:hypothetical protein
MSLNNFEILGYNSLANLASINADEVNTDILTKTDPEITDADFDTLEGINTTMTIQEQFDAIENQIGNIGASYWLSAWDTTTQTNPAANTPRVMKWNSYDLASNGITAGSTAGSIKVLHSNTYNIQFSVEVTSSNSSTSEITIWLRKNGSDVAASASEYDIKGNDYYTIGWNFVVPLEENDYVELMWASGDTTMQLAYQPPQTTPYTHPAIPSVIITVTNVTGEGAKGDQGPAGPQGPRGDRGPKGNQGDPGPATDGPVAYSALALAGTANAAAVALGVVVSGQTTAITGLTETVAGLGTAVGTQGSEIAILKAKTVYQTAGISDGIPSTFFSSSIKIPNYVGPGYAAIISTNSDNEFLRLIRTPQVIATGGTSSFDSIVTSSNVDVGNELRTGSLCYVNRTSNGGQKLVLFDNDNPGSPYNYNGIALSCPDGFNVNNIYNVGLQSGFSGNPTHIFNYADTLSSVKPCLRMDRLNHDITANSINLRASGNTASVRDAGIDVTAIVPPSGFSDLGILSIRGGIINIGNASSASIINFNGIINTTGNLKFGSQTYLSQWD